MNSTNRSLNRVLLAIVGLAAVGCAAVAVLLVASPVFARGWAGATGDLLRVADQAFSRAPASGTGVSAAAAIALLAALVFVGLLVVFILRQGRGSTATVVGARTGDANIEIDTAVPAALLDERLSGVPGIAAVTVSAYRVHRRPALKLTVRCRRGASGRQIADAVDDAVNSLHDSLGVPLPVFAQLVGGFRSRIRSAVRVDTSTSTTRSS